MFPEMGLLYKFRAFLSRFRNSARWSRSWQSSLNASLQEAQRSVGVNMVVVVARESDFYAELLFLASAFGLGLGLLAASLFGDSLAQPGDLLLLPLCGFALGSFLFAFRGLYLHRIAARAVRERVSNRAKSQFFDHEHHLKGPVVLLYVSELEHEALLLYSGSLAEPLADFPELGRILDRLVRDYDKQRPMAALATALSQIGEELRLRLGSTSGAIEAKSEALVLGATDLVPPVLRVPVLKGNKDVN